MTKFTSQFVIRHTQPNSRGVEGGPREIREHGFQSAPLSETGDKRRVRDSSFADHYSQARQLYRSLTQIEQTHIADATAFELSKVMEPAIRKRTVAQLVNVDKNLALSVSKKLGWAEVPKAAKALVKPRDDLAASDALSIIKSSTLSFSGRTIGVLVADGCDAKTMKSIKQAAKVEAALIKLIAKTVNGITDSDGTELYIDEKIDGGPSVLFDAIVLLMSEGGADTHC